jgi:hypothetical protein
MKLVPLFETIEVLRNVSGPMNFSMEAIGQFATGAFLKTESAECIASIQPAGNTAQEPKASC